MVKAEEVEALALLLRLEDAGLVLPQHEAEFAQDRPKRFKRSLGLSPGPAHDDGIICIAAQHSCPPGLPLAVEPMQVDIGKQG